MSFYSPTLETLSVDQIEGRAQDGLITFTYNLFAEIRYFFVYLYSIENVILRGMPSVGVMVAH